jgi:hypothetical protein
LHFFIDAFFSPPQPKSPSTPRIPRGNARTGVLRPSFFDRAFFVSLRPA